MSEVIHFLCNKRPINEGQMPPALAEYFKRQGAYLEPYSIKDKPAAQYLLIIEPIQMGFDLYACSSIWKAWLLKHKPDTRLIVAGYHSAAGLNHSNYLDLLNLPKDFANQYLTKVRAVSAFTLTPITNRSSASSENQRYEDRWATGLPITGHRIETQMRRFIEGHDLGNKSSFSNQMTNIRRLIKDLIDLQGMEDEFKVMIKLRVDQLIQEWDEFKIRWTFYKVFFEWLPFRDAYESIDSAMKKLDVIIKNLKRSTENLNAELIEKIRDAVEKEIQPFILPGDSW
jgi:hypothetical protein